MAPKSSFADQELSYQALERLLSTLSLARAGDFNVRMTAQGEGIMEREVADAVNGILSLLAEFTSELERVSESVSQGELRVRLPLDKANGGWGQQLRAINNIVVVFGKHVAELRRVIKAVHAGDLARPINVAPDATHRGGELARAAEEINAMISHVGQVAAEITRVFAEVGLDGRLNAQCHISDASGSWGMLVGSVNAASASLSEQVQDLCTTAQALAAGNLAARASVASRGDLQTLKLGLNGAADGLSALCGELRRVSQALVSEGKLTVEVNHPNPRGEWQSAQDAVNRLLATMASAFRAVTAQAERVLSGDYTQEDETRPPGELGVPLRSLEHLTYQQEQTQLALTALIDGRFGELPTHGATQRELILVQLGLRFKREFFRAIRGAISLAREQAPNPTAFMEAALSAIMQGLGAAAGAYYTLEAGQLTRSVNLGCDAPEHEAPLRVGEGLVGKVAAQRKPLVLEELEKQGLRLRTGLLELTPRGLVIFPVQHEERVRGVLELLFVNESAQVGLELLHYLEGDLGRPFSLQLSAAAPERVRALEEELVIAQARIERLAHELQARERAPRVAP